MKARAEPLSAAPVAGARSLLAVGTTSVLVGIALSAAGSPELGSWISVGSLAVLLYGLHRFGRSGADPASSLGETGRRRKKKRTRRSAERPDDADQPTAISEGAEASPPEAGGSPPDRTGH